METELLNIKNNNSFLKGIVLHNKRRNSEIKKTSTETSRSWMNTKREVLIMTNNSLAGGFKSSRKFKLFFYPYE